MAKDITLKTRNGETRYPKTVTDLIFENATGKTLQTIIEEMRQVDADTNTRTQHFKADVNNLDTLKNKTDIGLYNYVGTGWRGSVSVCYDSADNVSQVALSSSTPSYNGNTLTWLSAQPCAMARTYTNGAWSHWEKVGAPVVNDLTTGGTDKALSAEMGKTLKEGLDALGPKISYSDGWRAISRASVTFNSSTSVTIGDGYLYFYKNNSIISKLHEETTYTFSTTSYLVFNISSKTFSVKESGELVDSDVICIVRDGEKGICGGIFYYMKQDANMASISTQLTNNITSVSTRVKDIEDNTNVIANAGVYRILLDNTKMFGDGGIVTTRSSNTNWAILCEFNMKDIYSISFNAKYQWEILFHDKDDLTGNTFARAYWRTGELVLSSLSALANADRLRIRIHPQDANGNNVDFDTMVGELNPVIVTHSERLAAFPAKVSVLEDGQLAVAGVYANGARLFDSTVAKAGDIVEYEFSNETSANTFSQYSAIGFFDASGTRLSYVGWTGLTGKKVKAGSVALPEGFSYAATIWSSVNLVKICKKKNLTLPYEASTKAVRKNIIYNNDFQWVIAASAATTGSLSLSEIGFDGDVPRKLCLKCDSISSNNTANVVLRIDLYDSSNTRNYRYYYQSEVGKFCEYQVPDSTVRIALLVLYEVASTASQQTLDFNGITISLEPSSKEYVASDKVYIRDVDSKENDMFAEEVAATSNKIMELSAKPCLVYNILTDTHENRENSESLRVTALTLNNVKRVSSIAYADGLVHIGDILIGNQAEMYSTWEKVNAHLGEYVGRLRKLNDKVFVCVGNHDGLESNYPNEFHTYETMMKFNEDYVVRDGISPWYYKDYDKIKTRVVFLAIPSRDGNASAQSLTWGIGETQMKWIANTALNVSDEWNVLFFGHIHPYREFSAAQATIFAGITAAFTNRNTYNYSGDYQLSVDFSNRTGGKVLAFVAGHVHADAVISDNSIVEAYNLTFPIICIASSNRLVGGNSASGYTNPTRIPYDVSEDAWDTLVYRPDLSKIYMVRFGAGEDREINV